MPGLGSVCARPSPFVVPRTGHPGPAARRRSDRRAGVRRVATLPATLASAKTARGHRYERPAASLMITEPRRRRYVRRPTRREPRCATARKVASKGYTRKGLRRLDAFDRPNLGNHELPNRIVRVGFDLRDQVIFPEERIQLDDVLDLQELLVDFLLPRRLDVDQDEPDGRESPSRFCVHPGRR